MPAAWSVLLYERCGCGKALVWVGWQAMSSSRWREATALRGQFLLLSTCPETAQDSGTRRVEPPSGCCMCSKVCCARAS